jgi:hypothetical protein
LGQRFRRQPRPHRAKRSVVMKIICCAPKLFTYEWESTKDKVVRLANSNLEFVEHWCAKGVDVGYAECRYVNGQHEYRKKSKMTMRIMSAKATPVLGRMSYNVTIAIDGEGLTAEEVEFLHKSVVQRSEIMLTFKLEETRKIVTECMIGCGNHRT